MPELPEVQTVASGLQARLGGLRVRDCVLNRPDLRFPFPENLQAAVIGSRIEKVGRRAKYLLFELDNGVTLIGHLGMSGTMRVVKAGEYEPQKHDHLLWEFEDDSYFVFRDPRRFGFLLMAEPGGLAEHPMLKDLGPEPLEADFTANYLKSALSKRSSAIKVALMDQKLVVGVGNIYASEALFRARVSPFMPACDVAKHAKELVAAIQEVLREAIASGGSTLRDYVRSDGDLGYFQHAFAVYGRAGEHCLSCGASIAQKRQAGRSTFFCYKCQHVD